MRERATQSLLCEMRETSHSLFSYEMRETIRILLCEMRETTHLFYAKGERTLIFMRNERNHLFFIVK